MGEHRADMVRTLLGHPARDGKAIKKCGLVDVPDTGLAIKHAANANALRVSPQSSLGGSAWPQLVRASERAAPTATL
jgi:hypothetical protein